MVRRELQETHHQLKDATVDRERLSKDLENVYTRLLKEEEKNEEMRLEITTLKQLNIEIDGSR